MNESITLMKESATAEWQIRNGVYPATHPALEPIAKRITAIENFFVHIGGVDSNPESVNASLGQYDYERAASGKMTVRKWRETRFNKCFPTLSAQVVDTNGRVLAADEMISEARGRCMWTSNLVLTITAWSSVKPHTDDESLLKALRQQLSRFTCIDSISVRRSCFFWKFFPYWSLSATTKPLTLRAYEREILETLMRRTVESPGFECDISQSSREGDQSHQRVFRSKHLNQHLGI